VTIILIYRIFSHVYTKARVCAVAYRG